MAILCPTHPFIDFSLDLRLFAPDTWVKIGEAISKLKHIEGAPLDPETAKKMHTIYLAKGAAATTAIEGNTLSEEEVFEILTKGKELPKTEKYLKDEIENIVAAFNHMTETLQQNPTTQIDWNLLSRLNCKVLNNLELSENVIPGEFRHHNVGVGTYGCPSHEYCETLIERYCESLNNFPMILGDTMITEIVKAIYSHLYFVWIHPFGDGNGRTARLIEAFILMRAGAPSPAAHLLSNYFNRTRSLYYSKLDEARLSRKGPLAFIEYAIEGFVEGLRQQISEIRDQQLKVSWENFVYKHFRNDESASGNRRKKLLLRLPEDGVARTTNLRNLPPDIQILYSDKKSPLIFSRDLVALGTMGLVKYENSRFSPNTDLIKAFLPWKARPKNAEH